MAEQSAVLKKLSARLLQPPHSLGGIVVTSEVVVRAIVVVVVEIWVVVILVVMLKEGMKKTAVDTSLLWQLLLWKLMINLFLPNNPLLGNIHQPLNSPTLFPPPTRQHLYLNASSISSTT